PTLDIGLDASTGSHDGDPRFVLVTLDGLGCKFVFDDPRLWLPAFPALGRSEFHPATRKRDGARFLCCLVARSRPGCTEQDESQHRCAGEAAANRPSPKPICHTNPLLEPLNTDCVQFSCPPIRVKPSSESERPSNG